MNAVHRTSLTTTPQYHDIYHGAVVIRAHRNHSHNREARSMEISDWRKKIDELDEQIVALINRRAEAAKAIGELKQQTHMPIYEPNRERDVFDHVRACNRGPLPDTEMLHVYERIIDVMRSLQRPQEKQPSS